MNFNGKNCSMKNLGDIIKEAIRRSPKMSLRKLEILSGVTRAEISLIIHKKRKRPTPQVLRKLALPLKLDYTYLYTLTGYLDEEDYRRLADLREGAQPLPGSLHESIPGYTRLSRKKEELIQIIEDLPDREIAGVMDYIKLIRLKVQEQKREKG